MSRNYAKIQAKYFMFTVCNPIELKKQALMQTESVHGLQNTYYILQ